MNKQLFSTGPGAANTSVPTEDRKSMRYTEDDFIVDPHVPLFDEHSGEEEDLDVEFTEQLLQKIIDNSNHKIADTGDMAPIFEGHLRPDAPENEQGDLLGFATNFHMGTLGLDGRACIYADLKWLKDKYEKAKTYPRRSIELHMGDDMIIDNVGVLKRRPARNLGVLYSKNSSSNNTYFYNLNPEENEMNPEDIVKKCLEACMALPQIKYVDDLMKTPEPKAEPEGNPEKEKLLNEDEEADDEAVDMEKEEEEDEKEKPEKLVAQRDQARRQVSKLQASHKELNDRVVQMEKKTRRAERQTVLLGLEGEGIDFDLGQELEDTVDLTEVQFQKHVTKMRKNYSRAPIGVRIAPVEQTSAANEALTTAQVYAKLGTKTYKSALEQSTR